MFAALAVATPGIEGHSNTAVKAMATDLAQNLRTEKYPAGMGRGEYASYFGNLGAVTVAIGPMLYGPPPRPPPPPPSRHPGPPPTARSVGFIYAFGRDRGVRLNLGYISPGRVCH